MCGEAACRRETGRVAARSCDRLDVANLDHPDLGGALCTDRVEEDITVVSEGAVAQSPDDAFAAEEKVWSIRGIYGSRSFDDADPLSYSEPVCGALQDRGFVVP